MKYCLVLITLVLTCNFLFSSSKVKQTEVPYSPLVDTVQDFVCKLYMKPHMYQGEYNFRVGRGFHAQIRRQIKVKKNWEVFFTEEKTVFLGLKISMWVVRPYDQSSVGSYCDFRFGNFTLKLACGKKKPCLPRAYGPWEADFSSRGLIFGGEEISIPENRPIRKSYIFLHV